MSRYLSTTSEADLSEGNHSPDSSSDEDDQTWDEWASDSVAAKTSSLFEDKQFPSVAEALEYDKATYGFDLNETCSRLCSSQYRTVLCYLTYICVQRSISISVFAS
jgi:protein arginine N-methyltransferase 3